MSFSGYGFPIDIQFNCLSSRETLPFTRYPDSSHKALLLFCLPRLYLLNSLDFLD